MKCTSHAELVEYYFRYKELVLLHQKLKFGKAPRSSEGFTESMCCTLFNLVKAKGVKRKYDLDCPRSNAKIEVKATVEHNGTTSINPNSVFDYMIWVTFLLPQDAMSIRTIQYPDVQPFLDSHKGEKRTNITLSKYKYSDPSLFHFSKKLQTIVPQTLKEHLEHIKTYKA